MTLPTQRYAKVREEKQQLIQDIRKFNPSITKEQLSKYDIDDLQKIRMANMPQPIKGNTAGRPKMKYGGKMKRKYNTGQRVKIEYPRSVADELVAFSTGNPERGEPSAVTEARMKMLDDDTKEYNTLAKIKEVLRGEGLYDTNDTMMTSMSTQAKEKIAKDLLREMMSAKKGVRRAIEERSKPYRMGGMADMSAAPMVQPRKKKTQSGFRSKYSKGGGVRATKYKI